MKDNVEKIRLTDKAYTHEYKGTPFKVMVTPIQNKDKTGKSNYWNYNDIEVFKDGVSIGGYERSYSSFATTTFYPFQASDGEWYALYSKDYTATRVAKLGDTFEDWCGEEGSGFGFCPVEFFVPPYHSYLHEYEFRGEKKSYTSRDFLDAEYDSLEEFMSIAEEVKHYPEFETGYAEFGLMCGCIWGDDSSWKIRHIDLSGIPDKVLKITDKFGYFEMPNDIDTLQKCFRYHGGGWITLYGQHGFDLDKFYDIEVTERGEDE